MEEKPEKRPEEKSVIDGSKPEKTARVIRQGVGAKRRLVLETDGNNIHVSEMTVSPLEACEICRRIITKFEGGN